LEVKAKFVQSEDATSRRFMVRGYVLDTCLVVWQARQAARVVDSKQATNIFSSAVQKTWTSPSDYQKVIRRMEEIKRGQRPGSDLVILDDEFSIASRQL
jgi:hypothetical protein